MSRRMGRRLAIMGAGLLAVVLGLAVVGLAGGSAVASPATEQQASVAQQVGNVATGKATWGTRALCQRCHGANGEGGAGPDLAGRNLTEAQWQRQIRQPWGLMPAFSKADGYVTDAMIPDLAAYFASLPSVATLGAPRFTALSTDSLAQQLLIEKGCAMLHGPTMNTPRRGFGDHVWTYDMFKRQVRESWYGREELARTSTMPTFTSRQISDADLRVMWDYLSVQLGPLVPVTATLSSTPVTVGGTVTYTVTLKNNSKDVSAEGLTVTGVIPTGGTFVRAVTTPAGSAFLGNAGAGTTMNSAVWATPKIAGGETLVYSYEVSVGTVTTTTAWAGWTKPGAHFAVYVPPTPTPTPTATATPRP